MDNYAGSYMPAEMLMNYGGMQQQQQERQNAEASAQHQFNQNAPFNFMNQYLQGLTGINANANPAVGAEFAMNQMNQPSNGQTMFGNVLGLAGAGANLAGAFYNPMGAAASLGGNLLSGATPTVPGSRNTAGSQLPLWAIGR